MRARRSRFQTLKLMTHLARRNLGGRLDRRIKFFQCVEQRSKQAFELLAAAIKVILYVRRDGSPRQRCYEFLSGLEDITES